MPHRRRKNKGQAQPVSPTLTAGAAPVEEPPHPSREAVLGKLFEKVLTTLNERARFTDRIAPMAVFVYPNKTGADVFDVKAVHVRWQNELHKEIIRKRIHDKASLEGASAVILLVESGPSKGFLLSGATPQVRGHASVAYSYDRQAKAFSFSEMVWLNEPLQSFFLDGIRLKG